MTVIATSGNPSALDPAYHAAAVTPSDTVPLDNASTGIWVGGAGNLAVVMVGGETVTFVGVAAGTMMPIRCVYVRSSSTTATSIVAVWREG